MNHSNNKYILSSQRRDHGGPGSGIYIVMPNRAYNGNMLSGIVRPLALLLGRFCPG